MHKAMPQHCLSQQKENTPLCATLLLDGVFVRTIQSPADLERPSLRTTSDNSRPSTLAPRPHGPQCSTTRNTDRRLRHFNRNRSVPPIHRKCCTAPARNIRHSRFSLRRLCQFLCTPNKQFTTPFAIATSFTSTSSKLSSPPFPVHFCLFPSRTDRSPHNRRSLFHGWQALPTLPDPRSTPVSNGRSNLC